MLITINTGSAEELCIVEFQGDITGKQLPGNELGTITLANNGEVTMFIGQNKVEGELISLKNPFMLVKKQCNSSDDDSMVISSSSSSSEAKSRLEIQGYIRKKIIFRSRPKANWKGSSSNIIA